jgi:hypothetical protein
MEQDSGRSGSDPEWLRKAISADTDGVGNTSAPSNDRLPPPMFPPGDRRRTMSHPSTHGLSGDDGRVPEDAFIMPDEPMPRDDDQSTGDAFFEPEAAWSGAKAAELVNEAFIDPDAPIVRREPPKKPADFEEMVRRRPSLDMNEVVVTGIGDDAHLDDEDLLGPDAVVERHVREVTRYVEKLGDALRLRGEAGLRTSSDMTGFEVTLRAYCVGYLTRVREEETS